MKTLLAVAALCFATGTVNAKEEPVYKPCSDCTRSEVPAQYKWKLEHLVKSPAEWDAEFAALEKDIPTLATCKGTLSGGVAKVKACLDKAADLGRRADRLGQYAFQLWSVDRDDPKATTLYERSEYLLGKANSARSFIDPELLALDAKALEALIAAPELKDYNHGLDDLLRRKAHVLGTEGEAVASLMENLSGTPYTIMNSITGEMVFPIINDEAGKPVRLDLSNFPAFRSSTNREVRKAAVQNLFQTLDSWKKSLAASLAAKMKADVYLAQARGYDSALDAALDADAVDTEFFKTVLQVTDKALPRTVHKYVKLRQQILGLDSVHYYDLYTPLFPETKKEYTYEESIPLILEALKPLGEQLGADLKKGLDLASGWADVYPNKGKKSGAYCTGAYGHHPYVQLNFMGQLEDVFTTAHEFGHAMHFQYSMANQPYPKAEAPIFLAEIPSTFFEAMLLEHMLAQATDKATKMALLTKRLESMRTTIVRQLMFAEFEMLTHEELEKGGALTAERFSETYGQLIRKYYGPDLASDQYDAMEWAYIPHFYYNFYVYKYATSLMAAQVFAKRIVEGDETARAAFIELLKAGGSDYPVDILKKAGLDITDAEVLEESFDLFETTMKQLSALLD